MTTHAPTKWLEVKGVCPACGHGKEGRGNWCSVTADGDAILCRRNSAGRPVPQKTGGTAYLFKTAELNGAAKVPGQAKKETPKLTASELVSMGKGFRTAVNPRRLVMLAERLNVTVRSLEAYGIGWSTDDSAWSFPMFDGNTNADGEPKVCGFRLRNDAGDKWAVRGSREGLFVPSDFVESANPIPPVFATKDGDVRPLAILTPEGPTDCAAARDVGFRAIGRPSNRGGSTQLALLLAKLPPQEIVVVGEWDGPKYMPDGTAFFPGIEGALELAGRVSSLDGVVRLLMPPRDVKDIREWVKSGRGGTLTAAVSRAPRVTPSWLESARKRYAQKCQEARRK